MSDLKIERGLAWTILVTLFAAAIWLGVLSNKVESQGNQIEDLRTVKERLSAIEAKLDWLIDFQRRIHPPEH